MPTITEHAAQRYAAAVIDVLAGDFPELKDGTLGRTVRSQLARQVEAPMRSFELIVTYTREWRLVPDWTSGDCRRVQVVCRTVYSTGADGDREERINEALLAIKLED